MVEGAGHSLHLQCMLSCLPFFTVSSSAHSVGPSYCVTDSPSAATARRRQRSENEKAAHIFGHVACPIAIPVVWKKAVCVCF